MDKEVDLILFGDPRLRLLLCSSVDELDDICDSLDYQNKDEDVFVIQHLENKPIPLEYDQKMYPKNLLHGLKLAVHYCG